MKYVKTKTTGRLFDVDYVEYRKVLKEVKPDLPRALRMFCVIPLQRTS